MDENNTQDSTTPELSTLERQLLTQIDGLVTERDALQTKCFDLTTEQEQLISYANNSSLIKAKEALIEVLQVQVDGDIELEVASVIFAEFANKLGKTDASGWKNPFKLKYTVTIAHDWSDIMVITGVEAEDEEDAIELVKEDLSLDSPVRKGTLTYNGEGDSDGDVDIEEEETCFEWNDFDLSFSAEQE
jgi:hypothetical protein